MKLSSPSVIETDLPVRLDRLPWSRWHWRIVIALGITWILDGLEVTIVGSLAGVLKEPDTLHLTDSQIGLSASAYLGGAVVGALLFGWLTDRLGRKRLFLVSLFVYLFSTLATAFSQGLLSFAIFRIFTGAGIGGEYAAINSAIDELIPARVRGRVDLGINCTFWIGTALGAVMTIILLDPKVLPHSIGWRVCFLTGAVLGTAILIVRRTLPESPRWLLLRGRIEEAEEVVKSIEREVYSNRMPEPVHPADRVQFRVHGAASFREVTRTLFFRFRSRTILGLSLMSAQAFAYNAIFFSYALVLSKFYGVASNRVGLYIIPFSIGNVLGPLMLGRGFDVTGRRRMITATYLGTGVLLLITGYAFYRGWLSAEWQTLLWCITFFVGSTAASSAYLTVSELFPVEMRGLAIAFFYAVGTGIGGFAAPTLLGVLIESGARWNVFLGYAVGAIAMLFAGIVAWIYGVAAEGKSLEELSSADVQD